MIKESISMKLNNSRGFGRTARATIVLVALLVVALQFGYDQMSVASGPRPSG